MDASPSPIAPEARLRHDEGEGRGGGAKANETAFASFPPSQATKDSSASLLKSKALGLPPYGGKGRNGALISIAAAILIMCVTSTVAAPPKRIVSINVCADQLVQMLAPKESVQALSFLAGDPQMSVMADQAAGYLLIRGQAEEVLPLEADLVIAGVLLDTSDSRPHAPARATD